MEKLIAVATGMVFTSVCGYAIGRAAKARRWSARGAMGWCFAAGVIAAPTATVIAEAVSGGAKIPGWATGASVVLMWVAWGVCARTAGFRVNQVAEEDRELITLRLDDHRGPTA